jgi:hypothetical protein
MSAISAAPCLRDVAGCRDEVGVTHVHDVERVDRAAVLRRQLDGVLTRALCTFAAVGRDEYVLVHLQLKNGIQTT